MPVAAEEAEAEEEEAEEEAAAAAAEEEAAAEETQADNCLAMPNGHDQRPHLAEAFPNPCRT